MRGFGNWRGSTVLGEVKFGSKGARHLSVTWPSPLAPHWSMSATLGVPANSRASRLGPARHSHKVRAHDGIMLVNQERVGEEVFDGFVPGLGIYDVSEPTRPRLLSTWKTTGRGVHRFDFDGRYAYLSTTMEGFIGNIVVILDLSEPTRPEVTGRAGGGLLVNRRRETRGIRGATDRRRAAIIRSEWVSDFTKATGTTAASFSTFPTFPRREKSPNCSLDRLSRIRDTPPCRYHSRFAADS